MARLAPTGSPPSAIGRHAIIDRLGQGGMGVLYLGRSQGPGGFDRLVAIKVLHEHLSTRRPFLEMFLDEARIAAHIRHPNVVSVYEIGEDTCGPFIVMEYVSGATLGSLLSASNGLGRMIPIPVIMHLIASAAEGLHAAHEVRGSSGEPLDVVHRDVSPQNLLVGFDGVLRVTDFGVAKAVGRLAQTQAGGRKGKLAYMAPEQIEGRAIDRRADIHALGVVLWEALTQRRLFFAENDLETTRLIMAGDVPAPSQARPDCPLELDEIVLRALSRDPADRYPTARDFASAVFGVLRQHGFHVAPAELERFVQDAMPEQVAERRKVESGARRWGPLISEASGVDPTPPMKSAEALPGQRAPMLELFPAAPGAGASTRTMDAPPTGLDAESQGPAGDPQRRKLGRALFIVAAGLTLLSAAVTALVMGRGREGAVADAATPTIAVQGPAGAELEASHETAAVQAESLAKPEKARTVIIRFDVRPQSALLKVDGLSVVGAELSTTMGSRHKVEVTAPGYRTYRSEVVADSPSTVRVELQAQPPKRAPGSRGGSKPQRVKDRLIFEGDL